jgi:hypothetical protein
MPFAEIGLGVVEDIFWTLPIDGIVCEVHF